MWILGLEAGAALLLLVFIVWWTMYSGREPEQPGSPRPAERQSGPADARAQPGDNDTPSS